MKHSSLFLLAAFVVTGLSAHAAPCSSEALASLSGRYQNANGSSCPSRLAEIEIQPSAGSFSLDVTYDFPGPDGSRAGVIALLPASAANISCSADGGLSIDLSNFMGAPGSEYTVSMNKKGVELKVLESVDGEPCVGILSQVK